MTMTKNSQTCTFPIMVLGRSCSKSSFGCSALEEHDQEHPSSHSSMRVLLLLSPGFANWVAGWSVGPSVATARKFVVQCSANCARCMQAHASLVCSGSHQFLSVCRLISLFGWMLVGRFLV